MSTFNSRARVSGKDEAANYVKWGDGDRRVEDSEKLTQKRNKTVEEKNKAETRLIGPPRSESYSHLPLFLDTSMPKTKVLFHRVHSYNRD